MNEDKPKTAGRHKLPPSEKRGNLIQIWVNDAEHLEASKLAKMYGVSIPEITRALLKKAADDNGTLLVSTGNSDITLTKLEARKLLNDLLAKLTGGIECQATK